MKHVDAPSWRRGDAASGAWKVKGLVLIVAGVANFGCAPAVEAPVPLEVRFRLDETAFTGPPVPANMVPFDVVSSDMDLDGDADLLVNWHNLAPIEIYENRDGGFAALNEFGADVTGVFENAAVSSLYADTEVMLRAVEEHGAPGVFVWHEPSRRGDWHIFVVPGDAAVDVDLRANKPLLMRLDPARYSRADELTAALSVDEALHFQVGFEFVATQLVIQASAPVFVGADLEPLGEVADLWKDDPHGIAWVDVRSSPQPEIFITRGGLEGSLLPPLDPKSDRFFEYVGGTPRYLDVRELVPPGYGRGRRLEWVDVDQDGINELYVGNTSTPNSLLAVGGTGAYEDIAASTGLDFVLGDTFAWVDVDADGRDDLVFVDAEGFGVAFNRGERRFDVARGDASGLVFPAGIELNRDALFVSLALYVVDVDNDGVLDLWLSGYGADRRHRLYRGIAGGGFVDATVEAGVDAAPLANSIVFVDVDNDGDADALTFGDGATWLTNDNGNFVATAANPAWGLREFSRTAAIDVDNDERTDIVVLGHRRLVLRNETVGGGAAVGVSLRGATGDPVGAVVTAFYASGMKRAQRYGSAASSRYSQGLGPLHFGIPVGDSIERIEVRWPDGGTEARRVGEGDNMMEFSR